MKVISGTLNGTGADLYVGIGFIPDWVRAWNLEGTDEVRVDWNKNMRSAEQLAGLQLSASTTTPLTVGTGIAVYRGGDEFTTAQTAYVALDPDTDKRDSGTGNTVTKWTLQSSSNKTGKFDAGVSTTYVGEGSVLMVQEEVSGDIKEVVITSMTNDGDGDNEVTLSEVVQSGDVLRLTGMYDYIGIAANIKMPKGFAINNTTLNVSGNMLSFEAGIYDA